MSGALREALGLGAGDRLVPVGGGDINEAFRVELGSPRRGVSRWFAKTHRAPPPGMFEAEAAGLAALAEAADDDGLLHVPTVVSVGPGHLALEWMGDREGPRGGGARDLGVGLARLHRHTAEAFGFTADNWIGTLPQRNAWLAAGPAAFFAERRLRPQAERAARAGALPKGAEARLERVCARLEELVPDEPPALIHGDLWGGNWMEDGRGRPWIFDPAVAYAPREQELAFTRLFGGFPPAFYDAYQAEWPLAPGFAERVDLWNLYPLLVHANLFGGGYGASVDRIARRFA